MNRQEIVALGVGVFLILAVVGIAQVTDAVSIVGSPYEESSTEEETAANVTAVQAMRIAENETRGTAVGIKLTKVGNATDLDRPIEAYAGDVLTSNGTQLVVHIYTSNGTVLGVGQARNESEDLGSLFGNGDEVPDDGSMPPPIRSGIEAAELAWNATQSNLTVTEIRLRQRNETLVYEVDLVTAEGARTTVVVAADASEGEVLSIEGEVDPETPEE